MPNIFQKLSAQIRALKEENEELKRNPISQQRVEELKGQNEDRGFIIRQQTNYINILKQENTKLKETIEEYKSQMNDLMNLMDAPPSYEEVVSNPLKIQALVRGFLTRKHIQTTCCVCYEKCFNKNTCCNSFLCGECRPRCEGRCPMCRKVFEGYNPDYYMFSDSDDEEEEELNLAPHANDGELVIRWREPSQEGDNPFRFWTQLSYRNFNNGNERNLRNRYRGLSYYDVPETHRLNLNRQWGIQMLSWLNTHGLINLGDGDYSFRYYNFHNIRMALFDNPQSTSAFLRQMVDMPSHWTNAEHSPQVYRINGLERPYQYSHSSTGIGRASGFPRDIGNEYLGQTGEAKTRRAVYRIMEFAETGTIAGMRFKYVMVKYEDTYNCIIQYTGHV